MIKIGTGKRVKLSSLLKWADKKENRSVDILFSAKGDRHITAFAHEGDECESFLGKGLIDDISPKILGRKFVEGKK
jgi:hypothetical protein